MKTIDKIRDFIAKGETEKAVELLVQYTKEQKPTLQNDAVLLSSRYQQWKRNVTIGINESSNDLRHIENGILTLLENSNSDSAATPPPAQATINSTPHAPVTTPPKKTSNLMPIVLGFLGLGTLMMMGFWMLEDDHSHDDKTEVVQKPKDETKTTSVKNNNTSTKKENTEKTKPETKITETKPIKPEITKTPEVKTVTKPVVKPVANLPKVNGKNVNFVEVGNGNYRHIGNKKWVEEDNKTFKSRFSFEETSRDDFSVYLFDKARKVKMRIDLHRKKMTYADPNTKERDQYNVVNSMSQVKGKQVVKTEFANGYFEFKGGKKWEEKAKGTNKLIDTFKETARDEWSVYLTNGGKDIRLDLYKKKVMYNEKGKSPFPLYDITRAY